MHFLLLIACYTLASCSSEIQIVQTNASCHRKVKDFPFHNWVPPLKTLYTSLMDNSRNLSNSPQTLMRSLHLLKLTNAPVIFQTHILSHLLFASPTISPLCCFSLKNPQLCSLCQKVATDQTHCFYNNSSVYYFFWMPESTLDQSIFISWDLLVPYSPDFLLDVAGLSNSGDKQSILTSAINPSYTLSINDYIINSLIAWSKFIPLSSMSLKFLSTNSNFHMCSPCLQCSLKGLDEKQQKAF